MNTERRTFQFLLALTASLILPLAATAAICPVSVDGPAILTVDAPLEIALNPISVRDAVILENSANHLVIATRQAGTLLFETPACDLQATAIRAEIREHRILRPGDPSLITATSFLPLAFTKEEDHEFDPDPKGFVLKEEDHEFDPDPKNLVFKEEDHEFDPDPKVTDPVDAEALVTLITLDATIAADHLATPRTFTGAWDAASAVVSQLGPGWYFVVLDGAATQEILVEAQR